MKLRAIVHDYLEKTPTRLAPRIVQLLILVIILLNVVALVLSTVSVETAEGWVEIEKEYAAELDLLELVSVLIFTAEYILRLWSITVDDRYARPIAGRLRYALTPMALVDLIAILPFYALYISSAYLGGKAFLAVRALRLLRVFRVLKVGHYSRALQSLGHAVVSKRAELAMTVFAILILLLLASTLMYYAEKEAQPDRFSSIPATMWWGIVTLTTVGYGDLTPVTPLGKLAGAVVAVFGIGLVALPAGILSSAFIEQLSRREARKCPHCGKEI